MKEEFFKQFVQNTGTKSISTQKMTLEFFKNFDQNFGWKYIQLQLILRNFFENLIEIPVEKSSEVNSYG